MWQEVVQASGGAEVQVKTGTFTGNNSNSITITLADNVEDIKSFAMFKDSGAVASSVMSVFFDSVGHKFSTTANSSSVAVKNTTFNYSSSGKSLSFSFETNFKFIDGATYKYYYVV